MKLFKKLLLLPVFILILGYNYVSSFNYMEDFKKSAEIEDKLRKWENITNEEKLILKRLYNYTKWELKVDDSISAYDANVTLKTTDLWEDIGFQDYLDSIKKGENYFEKYIKKNDISNGWILLFDKRTWYIDPEFQKALLDLQEANNISSNETQEQLKKLNTIDNNRQKAVEYVLKWTSSRTWEDLRNPNYYSFFNDCTNFISQVLEAWWKRKVKNGWWSPSTDVNNWYFYWWNWFWYENSRTWTVAHDLMMHFFQNSNFREINRFNDLERGDIIFFDWWWINWTNMDHVVVVTWIDSADYNWVKISAHTNDRHNISFLSFMNEARKMENVHYVNYRIWKVSYWNF